MSSAAAAADSATEPLSRKRMHAICQKRQNKPLIEKRRRARINDCLLQLKAILMKDLKKESPRPSKLEKADILEMTVDYIKKMADRKPESTDKECLTDKTTGGPGGGGGMPFLNGFSRCLEEVDTFLNTQLPLQPEVRHKLLSHCKQQLSTKNLALKPASPSQDSPLSSLGSASPCEDPPGRHLTDSASDLTSEDEEKLKLPGDGTGVDVAQTVVSEPPATAFVAPFVHTASLVSCPQSLAVQNGSSLSQPNNNGLKLAGPLKLICGGNVFIMVDQQQQQQQQQQPVSNCMTVSAAVTATQPQPSPTPSLSGQVLCHPQTYSSPPGVAAAYIPAAAALGLPQVNAFAPAGLALPVTSLPVTSFPVPAGSVTSFPVAGHVTGCSLNASAPLDVATGTFTLHSSVQSGLLPPFAPLRVESPTVGNDINNNVMNVNTVWRPWVSEDLL